MNDPKRHHYIPEFYLKRWAINGKITTFQNYKGEIKKSFPSPKGTGFEFQLYSYSEKLKTSNYAEIETNFLSKLDSKGAKIVKKLINNQTLEKEEPLIWAKFILALKVRTPENISRIKQTISVGYRNFLNDRQKDYEKHKAPNAPDALIDLYELNSPGLIENIGVGQIPKIYSDQRAITDFLSFDYHVLHTGHFKLLSSDRPLLFIGRPDSPDCIIALPLSPSHAFFATKPNSNAQKHLHSMKPKKIVYLLNRAVARQAKKRVYTENGDHVCDKFLKKHLRIFA